jgi:hypothetical protein
VICEVWKSATALEILVVTSRVCKWSINPFTNPNSDHSHTHTHTHTLRGHTFLDAEYGVYRVCVKPLCSQRICRRVVSKHVIFNSWFLTASMVYPALPDFLRSSGSERGPFSLVRVIEELLEWKSSGSGLENRN